MKYNFRLNAMNNPRKSISSDNLILSISFLPYSLSSSSSISYILSFFPLPSLPFPYAPILSPLYLLSTNVFFPPIFPFSVTFLSSTFHSIPFVLTLLLFPLLSLLYFFLHSLFIPPRFLSSLLPILYFRLFSSGTRQGPRFDSQRASLGFSSLSY